MKKTLSIALSLVMVFAHCFTAMAAVSYDQPFAPGTQGSETFRIPAIYTLNDGSVIAAADARYDHGKDAPHNIDTLVAISDDGYTGWNYNFVNFFDDYAGTLTSTDSASFIDSAIAQSKETGRIFIITDVYASNGGYSTTKNGSGFVEIDGKRYLGLTTGDIADWSTFEYYAGDFEDGFAQIYKIADGSETGFCIDREYRVYEGSAPVMVNHNGSNAQVQASVFYSASPYKVFRTAFLWLRYSDDNGTTWSYPEIISKEIKSDAEGFLGIGPGRGTVINYNGKERIIFCVYDTVGISENVSTIYSDNNGVTWQRGAETYHKLGVGKTSEAQIIELHDGTLRMFARTDCSYVAYADSKDGGHSWTKFRADFELESNGNCMVSFINTSKVIDGKPVVLGSYSSDTSARADGVVKVGLIGAKNKIEWISTYHVNDGFFAYSCLTEFSDGNFGYLYEDLATQISYKILTLSDDGTISEINGDNCDDYKPNELSFRDKIVAFFNNIILKIQKLFGLM